MLCPDDLRGSGYANVSVTSQDCAECTLQDEPYMMMKEDAAFLTGNERFQGYVADILRLVAASLGFDYEICLSTDGKYGEKNDYGQWNGITGEVVRGVRIAYKYNRTVNHMGNL